MRFFGCVLKICLTSSDPIDPPAPVTITGIVIVAVLQAFHHLGRDAQRAPTGEKMLQELAVMGDFKCRCHSLML